MPWTADDADSHIKGLSDSQKAAWAKIANAALKACTKKGGSDCEGSAVRIANAGAKRVSKAETITRDLAFVQLTKFNADTGAFEGVAASSRPDKDNEIMDYATAKPAFKAWSQEIKQRSGGKSVGNVREMHRLSAVGRLTQLTFDDDEELVLVKGIIDDEQAKHKAAVGVYSGLSIGGGYAKVWADPTNPRLTRFTPIPTELSLVDNPANPDASFELVKAGKTMQQSFAEPGELAKCDWPIDSITQAESTLRYGCEYGVKSDEAKAACEEAVDMLQLLAARAYAAEAAETDDDAGPASATPGGSEPDPAGADIEEMGKMTEATKTPTLLDQLKGVSKEDRKAIRKALGVNGKRMRETVTAELQKVFGSKEFSDGLAKSIVQVITAVASEPEKPKGAAMEKAAAVDVGKAGEGKADDAKQPLIMPDGSKFSPEVREELKKAIGSMKLVTDPSRLGYRTGEGHVAA